MVRFKRVRDQISIPPKRCFNSTMVRFKLVIDPTVRDALVVFQFHDGSIQARDYVIVQVRHVWFQFHDGSIQASSD